MEGRALVKTGLADQVYEIIQARILDMEFPPGEKLGIDALAREIGVSSTPVRDALGRLAAEHLIEFAPYKGFTVLAEPSIQEITESFEAREGVEAFAAQLGTQRVTEAQIEEMRRSQAAISSHRYEGNFGSYVHFVRENRRFHELIVATSANRFLVEANRNLYHDLLIARTMHDRGIPDLEQINAEHGAIIDAFEQRDTARVVQAVVRHIEDGAKRIVAAQRRADGLGRAREAAPVAGQPEVEGFEREGRDNGTRRRPKG